MVLKYNLDVDKDIFNASCKRLTNQIYKLLPNREENVDWKKPLETIIVELVGMHSLFYAQQEFLFPLICKLEGLLTLTEEDDFLLFRRTIFECLSLMDSFKKSWQE